MTRNRVDAGRCLSDKQPMPKIATKFTANVTLRVGRQSMSVKMPIDLSDVTGVGDDAVSSVRNLAKDRLDGSMRITVVNAGALKKAHKAYKRAHP